MSKTLTSFAVLLALGAGCNASKPQAATPDAGGGGAVSVAAGGGGGTFAGASGAAGTAGTAGSATDAGSSLDAAVRATDADVATADGGTDGGGSTLPGWTLTFSEEFDGAAGTSVDKSKWNLINKGDGFGNNELEYYTDRTSNLALDGKGSLVITARQEQYMTRNYTSAKLETSGKFEQLYGRFEARLKLPQGQGIWPAFWMLGNNINSGVNWPDCGEIDIMENIGKEPSTVHGSLHGPGYSGGNPLSGSYMLPSGKLADDFHVFAIEWEVGVVRFYMDDKLYETRVASDVPAGKKWVYDHPFFLILNVAVGGQWPGAPDQSTVFPQTMAIDYIRVYKRP